MVVVLREAAGRENLGTSPTPWCCSVFRVEANAGREGSCRSASRSYVRRLTGTVSARCWGSYIRREGIGRRGRMFGESHGRGVLWWFGSGVVVMSLHSRGTPSSYVCRRVSWVLVRLDKREIHRIAGYILFCLVTSDVLLCFSSAVAGSHCGGIISAGASPRLQVSLSGTPGWILARRWCCGCRLLGRLSRRVFLLARRLFWSALVPAFPQPWWRGGVRARKKEEGLGANQDARAKVGWFDCSSPLCAVSRVLAGRERVSLPHARALLPL